MILPMVWFVSIFKSVAFSVTLWINSSTLFVGHCCSSKRSKTWFEGGLNRLMKASWMELSVSFFIVSNELNQVSAAPIKKNGKCRMAVCSDSF